MSSFTKVLDHCTVKKKSAVNTTKISCNLLECIRFVLYTVYQFEASTSIVLIIKCDYCVSFLSLFTEFFDLLPDDMIPRRNLNFRHIVPVSAVTGFGINHLKSCIRQSLDEDAVMAAKTIHQERLQSLRSQLT